MSEVNRTYGGAGASGIPFVPLSVEQRLMNLEGRLRVLEQSLQGQRLRADTAECERNTLLNNPNNVFKKMCDVAIEQRNEAKTQLAAAEQRSADLAATLTGALKLLRGVHTGDLFGPDDWETVNEFLLGADAALNPNPEAGSHDKGA